LRIGAVGLLSVLFAFGVPTVFTILLLLKQRSVTKVGPNKVHQVQRDLRCTPDVAKDIIQDIQLGSSYGFLVDSYKSRYPYWEMIDLYRKLLIVGVAGLFGRGDVVQLFIAVIFSAFFFTAQMKCWPMKIGALCC
jgi:hypothetical protein